jgi:hypothetical protein
MNSPFLEHRVPELLDEVVAMYRAAGRPLASLADGDLDAHFVDTVEGYIADPRNPARFRAVNDTAAEYVLRRRAAPAERVVRLKKGTEIAGNQPHKPKLAIFIGLVGPEDQNLPLPMVVLGFGGYAVIPAIGAIAAPEGSEESHAEFRWLLGLSAPHSERVVNLDAARAKRTAGKPGPNPPGVAL